MTGAARRELDDLLRANGRLPPRAIDWGPGRELLSAANAARRRGWVEGYDHGIADAFRLQIIAAAYLLSDADTPPPSLAELADAKASLPPAPGSQDNTRETWVYYSGWDEGYAEALMDLWALQAIDRGRAAACRCAYAAISEADMSVFLDMAHDGGYRGDEAREVAAQLETQGAGASGCALRRGAG